MASSLTDWTGKLFPRTEIQIVSRRRCSPIFPWINPWRKELQNLLDCPSLSRKPALRRSLREDYLFASDLPACASPANCAGFCIRAESAGWEALNVDGWIQLRRADGCLPEGWFPDTPEGEAACIRELICRHPGTADASRELILLLKAREEGPRAWELACRRIHQDLARRLREGEPLPRIPFQGVCP